ncbi:hypothetical protein ABFS82_14G133000 [Erythranthe guttata]
MAAAAAATLGLPKLVPSKQQPHFHSKLLVSLVSHTQQTIISKSSSQNQPLSKDNNNNNNTQKLLLNQTTALLHHLKSASLPLTALALPFFLHPEDAVAAGGEFGIFEGRSFALIHPIVMGGLFIYTVYAGYLGWQWRRVRTIQEEVSDLKKQLKPVPVTPDGAAPATPSSSSPLEAKIQQLTEERKELIKGSYREKHFNAGSILLAFGVSEAIFGGLNTWLRTGKLFPGPHLFAGAGITILWAAAAALVPPMQKGNEAARNLHIALNLFNLLLFIWQIPTGIDIVFKVFEFTKWP